MFDILFQFDCVGCILCFDCVWVMGIVNVILDLFFDGGVYDIIEVVVVYGLKLVEEGVDFFDIGGELICLGVMLVLVEEELGWVILVIEQLVVWIYVLISIDIFKLEVMCVVVVVGVGMINDIFGLCQEGVLDVVVEIGVLVVLMYMQGELGYMQVDLYYDDVVVEVYGFLVQCLFVVEMVGIVKKNLLIDFGFGFGKIIGYNMILLVCLECFLELGVLMLVGFLCKCSFGELIGCDMLFEWVVVLVVVYLIVVQCGVCIVCVYDVVVIVDVLKIWQVVEVVLMLCVDVVLMICWLDED